MRLAVNLGYVAVRPSTSTCRSRSRPTGSVYVLMTRLTV